VLSRKAIGMITVSGDRANAALPDELADSSNMLILLTAETFGLCSRHDRARIALTYYGTNRRPSSIKTFTCSLDVMSGNK
jgi:hypothetical protein